MSDDIWLKAMFVVGLVLIALGIGGVLIGSFPFFGMNSYFITAGLVTVFSALYGITDAKLFKIGMYLSFLILVLVVIHAFTVIDLI